MHPRFERRYFPAPLEGIREDPYLESFRRAPWMWEPIQPGPGDQWGDPGPYPDPYVRHVASGVIIRRPISEEEVMETKQHVTSNHMSGPAIDGAAPPDVGWGASEHSYVYRSAIKLGKEYRETQTGYKGHAVAVYFYQNSCERVELEHYSKKRGLESCVFDAKRLELVEDEKITPLPDSTPPGGPDRGSPRRKSPSR